MVSSAMAYSFIHVVLTLVFEPQGQGDYNARKTCLAFVPFFFCYIIYHSLSKHELGLV